jgi:hypothetical protein
MSKILLFFGFMTVISCQRDRKPPLQASVALTLNKNPILEIFYPRSTRFSLDATSEVNFSLSPTFGESTSVPNFSESGYNAPAEGVSYTLDPFGTSYAAPSETVFAVLGTSSKTCRFDEVINELVDLQAQETSGSQTVTVIHEETIAQLRKLEDSPYSCSALSYLECLLAAVRKQRDSLSSQSDKLDKSSINAIQATFKSEMEKCQATSGIGSQ